jgi:hypothetical protein
MHNPSHDVFIEANLEEHLRDKREVIDMLEGSEVEDDTVM